MGRDIADIVAMAGVRAAREVGDLTPLLKDHCDPQTYEDFKLAIGRVIDETYSEIVDRAFAQCPGLEAEFEAKINRFGRAC